jgi:hypothetical protein
VEFYKVYGFIEKLTDGELEKLTLTWTNRYYGKPCRTWLLAVQQTEEYGRQILALP